MPSLALIRHAPTRWNEAGRIQGRRDVPLGASGRRAARAWRLPGRLAAWRAFSSPLARARETAALLGMAGPEIDMRLIEMDWGAWTGATLAGLRREGAAAMAANEAAGLDFRPEGGESPREVQRRLTAFLHDLARDGRDAVAVTHRGVIRAAVGLATSWDFRAPEPLRPDRDSVVMLEIATDGRPVPGVPALMSMSSPP